MEFKSANKANSVENIYLKSRIAASVSYPSLHVRGIAAEELHISIDSLFNYENEKTIPNEDMVFAMAELYGDEMLIVEHFMQSRTGRFLKEKFGIDYETGELSRAAIGFIDGTMGVEIKRLTSIVKDGVISRDELPDARAIKNNVREVAEYSYKLLWELSEAEANLQKASEKSKTALQSGSRRKLEYAI